MQRKKLQSAPTGEHYLPPSIQHSQHARRRRRRRPRRHDIFWRILETQGYLLIRRYKYAAILVLCVAIVAIVEVQLNDPLHITRWVDHQLTYRVMRRHFANVQDQLHQAGIHDIPPLAIAKANEIRFHAALTQVRWNQVKRQRVLESLAANARRCQEEEMKGGSCRTKVPDVMLVPDLTVAGRRSRPIYTAGINNNNNSSVVFFDATDMHHLVATVASTGYHLLLQLYESLRHDDEQRIVIWTLCAAYYYGGTVALGRPPPLHIMSPDIVSNNTLSLIMTTTSTEPYKLHDDHGYQLLLLSAPPRHAFLHCALQRLVQTPRPGQRVPTNMTQQLILAPLNIRRSLLLNQWHQFEAPSTCDGEIMEASGPDALAGSRHSIRLLVVQNKAPVAATEQLDASTSVEIQRTLLETSASPPPTTKQSLQQLLHKRNSEPGWICNRCLGYAARGTLEHCRSVCPWGYEQVMCSTPPLREAATERDLSITIHRRSTYYQQEQRIPRIIHQTWVEDISFERHPQFARLQASWKNTGWEYRFYTDDEARRYIVNHFPTAFVEAFDALIHGAYKADFFRYLVLLVDGGVYADVDVLLETTLDSFITPDMGFFGARDVPCEYAGEAFCIWNGFIGSEPGNPILVKAVERLVNLIRSRADMYDMEQEICQRVGPSMDVWKVRAQPLLFLTGPCGLGVAVNEALGRPSLQRIDFGSIQPTRNDSSNNNGETIILVADKFDLGVFRFSDPRRNFVVASTELKDLRNKPRDQSTSVRKHHHYSYSRRYNEIWGSSGVYTDNQAVRDYIRFQVSWS